MFPSVCPCVNTFKHEYLRNQWADHNVILSKSSWGCGKAALGFGPYRIRTLVSRATCISHSVIMGENGVATFSRLFLILAGNEDIHESSEEFEVRPDRTTDGGVSCP